MKNGAPHAFGDSSRHRNRKFCNGSPNFVPRSGPPDLSLRVFVIPEMWIGNEDREREMCYYQVVTTPAGQWGLQPLDQQVWWGSGAEETVFVP